MSDEEPHSKLPPRWVARLLHQFGDPDALLEVEGDLYELYQRWVEEHGSKQAQWLYVINVITFLRPFAIQKKENKFHYATNHSAMLRNYLTIAVRNLKKNKVFSLINILGLAIGMAACLLIVQYVRFELSYDQFHEKADRVYRAALYQYKNGVLEVKSATTFPVVGRALQENFSDAVEAFVRLHQQPGVFSYLDDETSTVFSEEDVFYTDAAFFDVFSFPLLAGKAAHALTDPNIVVITASVAEKYFGSDWQAVNPVGKSIQSRSFLNKTDLLITGVLADPPKNSHLKFDFLISYPTIYGWKDDASTNYREESENLWGWEAFYTYLLLKPDSDPHRLEKAFMPIVEQHAPFRKDQGFIFNMVLQSIEKIHLASDLTNELEAPGDAQTVYILLIIACCILAIAWINFVNLSTVKAIERAKEVGLRKVAGASRKQLIAQHLLEASLLNGIGILLAFTLFQGSLPYFTQFTGMEVDTTLLMQPISIVLIISLLIGGTMMSGLYPAFILSSYQPVSALKGKVISSRSGGWLKKGLVVFQFTMAAVLIMVVFTVGQQLSFMKNHELGVNIQQKLVVEGPQFANSKAENWANIQAYKTSVKRHNLIEHATLSRNVPATEIRGNSYVRRRDRPEEAKFYHVMGVDYDYMATFGLQLLAGRFFSEAQPVSGAEIIAANENAPDFGTNDHAVMVNETAARRLGFTRIEDAIDQQIAVFGGVKQIVGVVKDYHHKSLKSNFEPIVFYLQPDGWEYMTLDVGSTSSEKLADVVGYAEKAWKEIYPDEPFNYFFLDDYVNQQYQADQQFYALFNFFSGLAIFIACLGLFGLSSYTALQRTKEIGVRKVLGASVSSIVRLLSKDFIQLVLVASFLALPVAYWALQQWLADYAFRITIRWWLLALPVVLVLLITLFTVSFQTVRAALANPVDSLRNE